MPPNGYAMLRDEFDAIFIGALGDPRVPDNRHARDILLGTRFELDLYVNYRPVKLLDERLCPLKDRGHADVNFVVFRENTEGLYVSIGGRFKAGHRGRDRDPGRDQHLQGRAPHHPPRVRVRAGATGVTKVCMADKSNAMQQGHALWQRVFKELAPQYPEHRGDALLHRRARDVHGAGPGAVRGDRHQQSVRRHHHRPRRGVPGRARHGGVGRTSIPGRTSMFEPVHGSAPPLAGKNVANPIGAILVGGADAARRSGSTIEGASMDAAVAGVRRRARAPRISAGRWAPARPGTYIANAITSES